MKIGHPDARAERYTMDTSRQPGPQLSTLRELNNWEKQNINPSSIHARRSRGLTSTTKEPSRTQPIGATMVSKISKMVRPRGVVPGVAGRETECSPAADCTVSST